GRHIMRLSGTTGGTPAATWTRRGSWGGRRLTRRNVHHAGRPSAERKSEGSLRPRMMERWQQKINSSPGPHQ
ncbi:hypothetical protein J6590_016246, partial [Homalodisca vitripennis]